MLGAPPAFVLSQDQTLYKMIFNHFLKVFKSDPLSTQSLASCELLLWNFQSVPKHCKKVPLQVFDIVQFSRSCVRQPFDRRPVYFTTPSRACQALFSKCFQVLGLGGPLRGALRYSTTFPRNCQPPFCKFFLFLFLSPTPPEFPAVFLVNIPKTLNVVSNYLTCH